MLKTKSQVDAHVENTTFGLNDDEVIFYCESNKVKF